MVGVPDDLLDYEVLEPPQGENITLPPGLIPLPVIPTP